MRGSTRPVSAWWSGELGRCFIDVMVSSPALACRRYRHRSPAPATGRTHSRPFPADDGRTDHFAAGRLDASIACFSSVTERIVGGQEEPFLAALRHHRFAETVAVSVGVVGQCTVLGVHSRRSAAPCRRRTDKHLVFLLGHGGDGKRDREFGRSKIASTLSFHTSAARCRRRCQACSGGRRRPTSTACRRPCRRNPRPPFGQRPPSRCPIGREHARLIFRTPIRIFPVVCCR